MALDRTEQPTQKRREDARRKGQVAHSREVDTAIVLLAAFFALRFAGERFWLGMESLLRDSFAVLNEQPLGIELTAAVGVELIGRAVLLLLPLLLAILVLAVLGGIAQTGGVFSVQAVKPQASRISPLKGAKRVFASKQAVMQLVNSLVKTIVVGCVATLVLWGRREEITALGLARELRPSLGTLVDIGFELTLKCALALIVLAVADYLFQRRDWISQLRMTRQEVKDEHRQTEGDPQIRARIAQLRRSFLSRVLQTVPQADVVLTNPTHYAVALKYQPASDQAPRVVAKGERLIAQRIREVAIEHSIPVIENPPLARAIYAAVPVNHEITPELYEAVAEVLAFVYRLRYARAAAV